MNSSNNQSIGTKITSGNIPWGSSAVLEVFLVFLLHHKPYTKVKDITQGWNKFAECLCKDESFEAYNKVSGSNIKKKFDQLVDAKFEKNSLFYEALCDDLNMNRWTTIKDEFQAHISALSQKKHLLKQKKQDKNDTSLAFESEYASSTNADYDDQNDNEHEKDID